MNDLQIILKCVGNVTRVNLKERSGFRLANSLCEEMYIYDLKIACAIIHKLRIDVTILKK